MENEDWFSDMPPMGMPVGIPIALPVGLPSGQPPQNPGLFSLGPLLKFTGSYPYRTPVYTVTQETHHHPPGEYCLHCGCSDCRFYFGQGPKKAAPRAKENPSTYGYFKFVNGMRAASAKRDEDRQERVARQAESEPKKKDKAAKEQAKKKNMKRRRQ